MNVQYSLKISAEQAKEMPMVDLAFEVLRAANTPFYYRDLMQEIAKIKGLSDEEVMEVIAQLYTEINIDGRFACVGNNLWGLKRWYPVEKSEDAVGGSKHPRIINDDDDEEDYYAEEEGYSDEEGDYESFDGEHDEFGDTVEEDFFEDDLGDDALEDAELDGVDEDLVDLDEPDESDEDDFVDEEPEDDENR